MFDTRETGAVHRAPGAESCRAAAWAFREGVCAAQGVGVRFTGFTAADFAAYEERKRSSNVYNLERMRAKEKVHALRRAACELMMISFGPALAISRAARFVSSPRMP